MDTWFHPSTTRKVSLLMICLVLYSILKYKVDLTYSLSFKTTGNNCGVSSFFFSRTQTHLSLVFYLLYLEHLFWFFTALNKIPVGARPSCFIEKPV